MANGEGEENKGGMDGSGGVGFWTQTQLLIVKNWRCKLRTNKKKLAGEIFFPVFYLLLLSFLVKTQPSTSYPEEKGPNSPPINILQGLKESSGNYWSHTLNISVVPDGEDVKKICQKMEDKLQRYTRGAIKLGFNYFASVEELERAYNKNTNGTDIALIFSDTSLTNFNYTIMTDPSKTPSASQKIAGLDTCRMKQVYNEELEGSITCPVNGYFHSGFLGLQYLVDQAFLTLSSGNDSDILPSIEMQNFPKLEYNGGMSGFMRAIIPLYCVIPMAQLINSLLVLIVTEKEDRIKDGFRMIGVSDSAYWLSWFVVYSCIIGILSVMFTLVMHQTSILRNINAFLLFLIFFLFGLSVITFAFALTPFFHKPKTAGVVGTLIMQFCGMLFMVQTFVKASTDAFLVPLRLISSLAFTTALDEACEYEYNGGITFSDLLPGRRGARILYSLIFICFDTIFYGIIAVYLDNVIPNEYGAKKHPLFCFTWPFWKRTSSVGYRRTSLNGRGPTDVCDDENVEGVPMSMMKNQAITIRNIFKTYTSLFSSTKVEAVKGISLDIYDGQITAILGKNGAGKSTLFSIITGLVPPTKGKCNVFGMDTSDPHDMDRLRKITGVCLQTNLLFSPLTPEEHLQLYGKLRGLQGSALDNEVECILEELKLTEKAKVAAENLSGGQKRKLSVGIALIGDPKIILLDEPSAGVDPVSRRHLWSLLKRKKEGRVILLATHFLDEADFLADRKAIIHDGVLKCCGSSLFLKNRFGVGYHLTVETEGRNSSEECDAVIQKWAPEAVNSKKVIGKEIKYCLPNSGVHVFADLFGDLEQLIASANSSFKSYGVSMTTLEEVFLKISNDAWEEDKSTIGSSSVEIGPISENTECNLIPDLSEIKINIPESLWALSLLRIRRLIRSPQSLFFLVIMPLVLVACGLALMKTQDFSTRELLTFDDPKSIYSGENDLHLASNQLDQFGNLESFLRSKGFVIDEYSGDYSNLLDPSLSDNGTMAALKGLNKITMNLIVNGSFLHSPPLLLHALSQHYLNETGRNVSLSTNARSFPSKRAAFDATTFYAVFLIGPSFSFPAVGMVMELVKDREINARNHLRVNGVSFGLYFSSVFIVFGLLSVIVTLSQIALIYVFALPAFMNPYALTMSTILLLLFIIPCLLFSTLFSYFFDRLESAQSIFSPVSSWMGTIVGVVIIILDGLSVQRQNVLIVHGIFSALDIFYIPFGIFYWINKQYVLCSLTDKCEELSFSDYLGSEIMIMAACLVVQIPIFMILIVVADVVKHGGNPWSAIASIFRKSDMNASKIHILGDEIHDDDQCYSAVDEDVLNEKSRVENILSGTDQSSDSVVLVQNLKKTYQASRGLKDRCRNKKVEGHKALKGINFSVEKGEVFGLLGHNGAGKTTAMRIIIAEESSDSGIVRLCGTDIDSNYSDAFSKLGYCAQHDPLWENIRLREHLELYAVIRGIPKEKRNSIINQFLIGLQIGEHAKKKAAKLSGGTKRKLSYGISMMGAPRVVLLDEPSTGMDPQSKRFLWNTILGSFKQSRGAILTTHSMEEAEILCSRIAILAKGSLICIGSPQHLKSKYGSGYTLEIKLKPTTTDYIHEANEDRYAFVKKHFPDCKVNELFDDKAVFSLSTASVQSISKTFSLLEKLKQQYNVEEYSFSQTTLEQIFLNFAKEEDDENCDDSASDCELEVRS